jgi:hypothetical protein
LSGIDPKKLLSGLQQTLAAQGVDHQTVIAEFGQVRASEQRLQGKQFDLIDHTRGLILSLLSNQRPWGPIARKLDSIARIFFHYDPHVLKGADPDQLTRQMRAIQCGNRQIAKQMAALSPNIGVFEAIIQKYGSLDRFVESADPHTIASRLSDPKSEFKLRQVGYTLAMEYLRNVGVRACKPDVHLRRVIGLTRLGLVGFDEPSEEEAYRAVGKIADEAGVNPTYLDNLLWLLCAKNYGDVCGATPRCTACLLRETCHYPKRSTSL